MRVVYALAVAMLCAGCVTTETVQFRAQSDQQAIVRDGQAALVSRKKKSLVIARPAQRQFQIGGRPVFAIGINNLTNSPQDFRVSDVKVVQTVRDDTVELKVITYEM